eukprot:TRINITY_DN11375_c0_g1_i1.p1 TRINITY_DN11375_c0_g1~~TRINITY_DN11375_c0_g1_i1.p1  ORF type:complete len:316 (-),score=22.85 TRINITY_DN11375_c0_g1_i1:597-1544(-)
MFQNTKLFVTLLLAHSFIVVSCETIQGQSNLQLTGQQNQLAVGAPESEIITAKEDYSYDELYDGDSSEERQQIASLVLEAFQSEFQSNSSQVQALYPYILQIPTPNTPEEFFEIEQLIIQEKDANCLRDGDLLTTEEFVVPSVEGSEDYKCSLTRYPVCARFQSQDMNKFMVDLFEAIEQGTGENGIPKVKVSRYDLFYGYLFLDYDHNGVGILFHAKSYPKFNDASFPYNLGFCQEGSELDYSPDSMNHRNILWYKGQLGVLDVSPEGALNKLVWNLLRPINTVYESDFGQNIGDVNYFKQLDYTNSTDKLFIS